MDPEQTFLRVHARLSGMLAQLISPRLRGFLEHLCLIVAILLLALLAVMHVNFVSQAGCAKELSRDQIADAELLQIKMVEQGLWSHKPFSEIYTTDKASSSQESGRLSLAKKSWLRWLLSRVLRSIGRRRSSGATNGMNKYSMLTSDESDAEGEAALLQLWDSWTLYSATWLAKVGDAARRFAKFWRNAGRELLFSNAKDGSHAFSQKEPASVIEPGEGSDAFEPVYLYSVERGYLLLPEDAKVQHSIRTINISMSARNPCFGNRWQQLLINSLVGYDTILMNSLLEARGEGYLYNYQTKELYDLNYPREAKGAPSTFQGYVISKCGVLIMSLFVFFTTTMSVSFTLRETQARMLKFTVQLQYHARHRLPTFRLIFVHVIESLVFVPIMIGILFFLFEFYEDQLLAFMVLTLVWLCELFTMISVRTAVSMQYFPRYFFLYFMVFHIYFFSYEYGFSYLAFSTTAAFMQHLVLYFWNHFEVPALQRFMRARMVFQQPGVQITSSAIITSTFHVSRVPPPNVPSTAEESARNLSFLRHLRRPAGDHMNSNTSAFSQTWPAGSVDRWWLENWNNWSNEARSRMRTQNSAAADHNRNTTENLNRDPNRPINTRPENSNRDPDLNDSSNTTQDRLRESQATGQQGFQAPTSTAMPQPAALNSFASILLWILGGPSEHLLSYLPIFREANSDNNSSASIQTEVPPGQNDSEQGPQGLRRRTRNVSEGDHQTM